MSTRHNKRPESRASTTSATSNRGLSRAIASHDVDPNAMAYHMGHDSQNALVQFTQDMQSQGLDPYAHLTHSQMGHHHAQAMHMPVNAQYNGHDSPYMQPDMAFPQHARVGSVPIQPALDVHEDKRRKGSAVTATNDKELREMLVKNEGKSLRDVAQEVIQKERTPMAEKTKQLFAMLWLKAVCKPAKTSVPRNRVYSQYATRCGTERVVPLNPASFGKLVRVIFPGIQTRRLGVRGESKYHYVDLALEDEQANGSSSWQGSALQQAENRQRSQSTGAQQIDFNNIPRLEADTSAFETTDGNIDAQLLSPPSPRGPASKGQSFLYPESRGMQPGTAESLTYSHTLRFASSNMPTFSENEPVNLPSIHPYLPPRTDIDTAEALAALYRTHCTSLIDSIRFCKEKQFFRLYTSFHGTLTVPVQKLFTHPNLAKWIEQCDLVMYRTMVRFVSRLTLQAAPVAVINILNNISSTLHAHIAKTFSSQPAHVLESKLRPATIFAGLLNRLIRVNGAAHAAANLLTIDSNREQMWHEWSTMVNPKRVMEAELPDCGYEEVHKILTSGMRSLLEPLQAPGFQDDASFYSFDGDTGGFAHFMNSQSAPPSRSEPLQVSTENVLDRWSAFLCSLPGRFPHASARTVLHCISAVGTSALRDITIMCGQSYGHWWVLKIFVDEMALWLAEMGGFLEPLEDKADDSPTGRSPVIENGGGRSQSGSRLSSMGPGAPPNPGNEQGGQSFFMNDSEPQNFAHQQHRNHMQGFNYHVSRSNSPLKQQIQAQETDIDDSGIGMSLMDDDLSLSKFGVAGPHDSMEGMGVTDMRVHPL